MTTRSQRIHRGFHRVGVALAGVLIYFAVILIAVDQLWDLGDSNAMLKLLFAFAVAAVAVYALSRAVGWIIAGFAID